MQKNKNGFIFSLVFISLLFCSSAYATMLGFSILDPIGDNTGRTDLQRLDVTVDTFSGNYWMDFYSTVTDPFSGDFILNGNFQNANTSEKLFDNSNSFSLSTNVTHIQLSGVESFLTGWSAGDEIIYVLRGAGAFGSGIYTLPGDDFVGISGRNWGTENLSTSLQPVPEPSTVLLLGSGLLGLAWYGRKRKKA